MCLIFLTSDLRPLRRQPHIHNERVARRTNAGLVFQSCIPVASGIAFTAWTLGPVELVSAALVLTAGLWIYVLAAKAKLTAQPLIFNGFLYLLFLSIVLWY